jgi:Domain of unknown function (DUF3597)
MSVFSSIWNAVTRRKPKAAGPAQPAPSPAPQPAPSAQPSPSPAPAAQPVDVEAVLTEMAQEKGGGGNWRTSIVDLLKLLDLDSSLDARKELATELGVNAGPHGSAEQNIALSKAVWKKLAENGGQVPASLRD